KIDGNQPMGRLGTAMLLLHRDDALAQGVKYQPAVAAIRSEAQLDTGEIIQALTIQLLVRLIDKHQAIARQAQGAATVLIDPTTHTVARRSQPAHSAASPLHRGA